MTKQEVLNHIIPPLEFLGIKEGQLYDSSGRNATGEMFHALEIYGQQEAIEFATWISHEGYLRLTEEVNSNGWIKIISPSETLTIQSLYQKFKKTTNNG